ncbi:MAG TPA: hypothetical protein EYP91_00165 [Gammaproteobacteria bacterium]|jgi:hypothetical protein|nr:hypothetical protein [Gammaproteobacteria bacterium]
MNGWKVLRNNLKLRPWWMNGLLFFCTYMTFVYVPWDFFVKPVAEDAEVWFGILLRGWAAKATEPLHWLIYCAGMVGFLKMRPWMFPWASLYVVQVAISVFVWALLDERGRGLIGATISAIPFIVLAIALWRAKAKFSNPTNNKD